VKKVLQRRPIPGFPNRALTNPLSGVILKNLDNLSHYI
jgi:hypothetical protein